MILTGAGVSAESGVPTFRAADGLWEGHRVEDVATPGAYRRDPDLVHAFYDARRAALAGVQPNAAHHALARLEQALPGRVTLVTQNVDDLHDRAGSRPIHMHGELLSAWCLGCDGRFPHTGPMVGRPACGGCGARALRPDIVWFGEMPYRMDEIEDALSACDLFVSIGTSGNVYPAAGFVELAREVGARTLELNLDPSATSGRFDESRLGPATVLVPEWVRSLIGD